MPKTLAGIQIQGSIKAAFTSHFPLQTIPLYSNTIGAIYPLSLRSLFTECASSNRLLPSEAPWTLRQGPISITRISEQLLSIGSTPVGLRQHTETHSPSRSPTMAPRTTDTGTPPTQTCKLQKHTKVAPLHRLCKATIKPTKVLVDNRLFWGPRSDQTGDDLEVCHRQHVPRSEVSEESL